MQAVKGHMGGTHYQSGYTSQHSSHAYNSGTLFSIRIDHALVVELCPRLPYVISDHREFTAKISLCTSDRFLRK